MAEAAIPVDLFNPGQVFACLGLVEAAEMLLGDAEGAFDWRDQAETIFRLRANGDANPVAEALRFLAEAELSALAPAGSSLDTAKWSVHTQSPDCADFFPFPKPESSATLPLVLRRDDKSIVVDYWGDATRRDNVKFWAGSGGYPGVGLARDAQALLPRAPDNIASNPFGYQAVQTSSFRFDWRRDYVPLDSGFSPNDHASIVMTGYPAVELLAAIGMSNARPERPDPRNKLEYRYAVPGTANGALYPPVLMRAALGAGPVFVPGMPLRRFRMFLNWPGQEGQARAITDVVEETEA